MYKIIVSVFITWLPFSGTNLFGQSSHLLDSLINDFQHGSKKQKIEAANELAWQLRYNHKDSALNYAQWAYDAGEALGDDEIKFTALKRMGVVQLILLDYCFNQGIIFIHITYNNSSFLFLITMLIILATLKIQIKVKLHCYVNNMK